MGGENSYNQLVSEVLQDLIRQLLLAPSEDSFLFRGDNLKHFDMDEVIAILYQLSKRNVINIESIPTKEPFETPIYLIETDKEKLDNYYLELNLSKNEVTKVSLQLKMNDNRLLITLNGDEKLLRKLQDDKDGYKLFRYLFNNRLGRKVTAAELRGDDVIPNIRSISQLINDLKLVAPLKPFTNELSKNSINLANTCELEVKEAEIYLSSL